MENIGVTLGYIQVVICAVWYILTYLRHTLVHSGEHTMSGWCLRLGNCLRRPWQRKSGHIVLHYAINILDTLHSMQCSACSALCRLYTRNTAPDRLDKLHWSCNAM